jgi:hypothetical protein
VLPLMAVGLVFVGIIGVEVLTNPPTPFIEQLLELRPFHASLTKLPLRTVVVVAMPFAVKMSGC